MRVAYWFFFWRSSGSVRAGTFPPQGHQTPGNALRPDTRGAHVHTTETNRFDPGTTGYCPTTNAGGEVQ